MYSDEFYMQRCLDLAENALGKTYPNPIVGCVIVHEGKIIGEGTPEKIAEMTHSYTGKFLKSLINNNMKKTA